MRRSQVLSWYIPYPDPTARFESRARVVWFLKQAAALEHLRQAQGIPSNAIMVCVPVPRTDLCLSLPQPCHGCIELDAASAAFRVYVGISSILCGACFGSIKQIACPPPPLPVTANM